MNHLMVEQLFQLREQVACLSIVMHCTSPNVFSLSG